MSTFQPLYDRVLLKKDEPAEQTRGGLFLPKNAQETTNLATVVAVGTGRLNHETGETTPLKVEVGMTVVVSGKYAGTEVNINGVDHLVVREDEILGVIQ